MLKPNNSPFTNRKTSRNLSFSSQNWDEKSQSNLSTFQFDMNPNNLRQNSNNLNYLKSNANSNYDPQWEECQITGSNIMSRSKSSCVEFNGQLFIYGGYEHTKGALNDFWKISLVENSYKWQRLSNNYDQKAPGSRCSHTAIVYKNKMYVFGGNDQSMVAVKNLNIYNLQLLIWEEEMQTKTSPPALASHNSFLYKDKMIVAFGYMSETGIFSNAIFQFDFAMYQWDIIFSLSNQKQHPPGRMQSSCVLVGDTMHCFAGSCRGILLNDHWTFNFVSKTWKELKIAKQGDIFNPKIRSGHTMNLFENQIILFGGIHDITWQLDDLYVFDIRTNQWNMIDPDTSRGAAKFATSIDRSISHNNSNLLNPDSVVNKKQAFILQEQIIETHTEADLRENNHKINNDPLKISQYDHVFYTSSDGRRSQQFSLQFCYRNVSPRASPSPRSPRRSSNSPSRSNSPTSSNNDPMSTMRNSQNLSIRSQKVPKQLGESSVEVNHTNYGDANSQYFEAIPESPTKHLQEQRRKQFFQKKALLLKDFELNQDEKKQYEDISPTSAAMKNSLFKIGNPKVSLKIKPGKLSDFGRTTISRFLEPLSSKTSTIVGKKPCARDGHNAVLFNGKLFIFGGDRHQMSFNDLFCLNLNFVTQ